MFAVRRLSLASSLSGRTSSTMCRTCCSSGVTVISATRVKGGSIRGDFKKRSWNGVKIQIESACCLVKVIDHVYQTERALSFWIFTITVSSMKSKNTHTHCGCTKCESPEVFTPFGSSSKSGNLPEVYSVHA